MSTDDADTLTPGDAVTYRADYAEYEQLPAGWPRNYMCDKEVLAISPTHVTLREPHSTFPHVYSRGLLLSTCYTLKSPAASKHLQCSGYIL
ncbi:hypothetical protein UFOVP777_24 [uncultured Caudovirales phage]|uniref:Uncharacterized protein n=1 Tax=uncultured Caudovirales phage TaxID=2100421 RepID=A0A6J5NYM1_9CAUD|nr:hypothetical protein UFOVP777_24 [uncultured Caudovirales phage]